MVARQGLLTIAIIMIIVGAVLWGISGHIPEAVYTLSVVGQIVFWLGILAFIVWVAFYIWDSVKTR